MTDADYGHIPRDVHGRYRSRKLPSMRGQMIRLPARLDDPDTEAAWQERLHDPNTLIVLDLFCGAGGLSLGFEQAGFCIAAGIDAEPWAAMTHAYNFASHGVARDIRAIPDPRALLGELGLPRVDVLIGGPPCQGFARIGRGKLRSLEREDYYRTVLNSLYSEFMRFVEHLQPLAFVMENVPDMARYENGRLIEEIRQVFAQGAVGNYSLEPCILDAIHTGVPQRRQRLFLQGNRIEMPVRWPILPVANQPVTVRDAISDLPVRLPPSLEEALPYTATELTPYQQRMRAGVPEDQRHIVWDHIIRQVRDDDRIIFGLLPEGGKYRDLPPQWQRYRTDIFDDKYWKLYYDEPSWTITAHIRKDAYRYIHPDPAQCRTLSVREFARLQSFPDHFRFCGSRTERMRQIGNAVPPLLGAAIATRIYQQIRQYQGAPVPVEEAI